MTWTTGILIYLLPDYFINLHKSGIQPLDPRFQSGSAFATLPKYFVNLHNRWAIIISPYGTRLLLNTSGLSEKAVLYRGEYRFCPFERSICEYEDTVGQQDGSMKLAWKLVGRGRNGGVVPPDCW
jgi:hypothetical protein